MIRRLDGSRLSRLPGRLASGVCLLHRLLMLRMRLLTMLRMSRMVRRMLVVLRRRRKTSFRGTVPVW